MKLQLFKCLLLFLILSSSCVEEYEADIEDSASPLLVVEGQISGFTSITLSRTSDIDMDGSHREIAANLKVVNENGEEFPLHETGNGIYEGYVKLDNSQKYSLYIETSDLEIYQSDFVEVVHSPGIEQLQWGLYDDGLNILISSEDPTNSTHYYRWTYEEDWSYLSFFPSRLIYENGNFRPRLPEEEFFQCFMHHKSSRINIANTRGLSRDRIHEYKLLFINPKTEFKLNYDYTINVHQYALTKEAYEYWELLKKNTEKIGGLFDPQPVALLGNIHCITDASKAVIGYISAGDCDSVRLYLNHNQLPFSHYFDPYSECQRDSVFNDPRYTDHIFGSSNTVIISAAYNGGTNPSHFWVSSPECMDCRLLGGSLEKPPYFP